jgi:hypothetical protein
MIFRPAVLLTVLGLFLGLAVGVLIDAARDSLRLSDERLLYVSLTRQERAQYVASAFDVPAAFRRFREVLRPGERFALVVPSTATPDQVALYQQYGLYYLYPAIAARELSQAEAVLVLDPARDKLTRDFRPIASLRDGAWIGTRR